MSDKSAQAPEGKNSWLRPLLHVAAVLLSLIVIGALVRAFKRDGPAALEVLRTANVSAAWIAIATAAGLAAHAVFIFGWKRFLIDCGVTISFWQAARLFLASNLGRYLPAGKAWQMSIVAVMAAEQRLPAAVESRMPSADSISLGTMWTLIWTAGASWIAWGCALFALARGLLPDSEIALLSSIAAWIAPFLAGLIAIVAPAGLGVRDEVMRTLLTAAGLSAGSAIVLVVVARVGSTLLDVVPALIVLAIRKRTRTA